MWSRFWSIRAANHDLLVRGRFLKVACLALAFAALLDVPILLSDPSTPAWLLSMPPIAALSFAMLFMLAHVGKVRLGGALFALIMVLVVTFGSLPIDLATKTIGAAYVIPILVVGFVVGSTMVLVITALSLIAFLAVSLTVGVTSWTLISAFIVVTSGGLLFFLCRVLEAAIVEARRQAADLQEQESLVLAQAQAQQSMNSLLGERNSELEQVLALVNDLEVGLTRIASGIYLLPLTGYVDSQRMARLQSAVLAAVHTNRAQAVIVDLTSMKVAPGKEDTAYASLTKLGQALQLMGVACLLAGLSGQTAYAMVKQRLDARFATFGTVEDALEFGRRLERSEA